MVWKYQTGDNYDLYQLEGFKAFFKGDLIAAQASLMYVMTLQPYGLPGWRVMKVAAEVGVEDSMKNLEIVNRAISEVKDK